jgi:1-acyl-sn-glycerol-3-phosphate acyltransferase
MFYILQLTLFIVITISLAVLTISLGFFDRHGKRVYRINQLWAWLLLRMGGISLNVEGQENIDASQQYIFMVNHQSNVDIPVIVQSLARFQLRWIAKKELLWVPFFGWAMWATKHITVDRSDPQNAVKSLQRARERIAAGISVVVFPEGTRSTDGKLLRFKKGGFMLAVQANTKIVPVTINGSRNLLPSGAWRLCSGSIEVFVDKPIAVDGYRAGNLRLLSDRVRETIAAHLREPASSESNRTVEGGNRAIANRALDKQRV